MDKNKNSLKVFILITFLLSIFLSLVIYFTGGATSKYILLGYLAMLIPAIAVIFVKLLYKDGVRNIGWKRFQLKWLPIALFLIPVVIHLVCLPILYFTNSSEIPWMSWLTANEHGLYYASESFGWGTLTKNELILKLVINASVGLVLVSILAFFEEIGWRIWMLPRLIEKYSIKKGIIIGAIIWALWHIPFVLSEIHTIPGISKMTLLLLNPFGHFGAGIVISWIWLRTKSIWMICLAHGALNNWGQFAFKFMGDSPNDDSSIWLLIGLNGSLLLVGLLILIKLNNNTIQIKKV